MKRLFTLSAILFALFPLRALPADVPGMENPLKLVSHHASLSVSDLDKQQLFYEQVLGFKMGAVRKSDDGETRQMVIPGYAVNLTKRTGSVRNPRAEGSLEQGWIHIVLATPILDEVQKRLEAQHVKTRPAMMNGRLARLLVFDPEGNQIELIRAQ